MPNLVSGNAGGGGSTTPQAIIRSWDPQIQDILIGDKFYGFLYYQSNGKLIIREIDDNSIPIQIPDYRIGEEPIEPEFSGAINAVIPKYAGGETLEQAISNLDRYDILNYSEDVYKNWFTTANTTTFSWYTSGGGSNAGHLLMEVD